MRNLFLITTLLVSLGINAQKVSIEDAQSRAVDFLTHSGRMKKVAAKGLKNSDLTLAESNSEKIYVFNVGDDEGYVVVSGDSRTRSILGYGNGHGFDMESAPDNMKAWLRDYELAISELDDNYIPAQMSEASEDDPYGEPIEPLLKSRWNQYGPYNYKCPEVAGQHCVTGCVGTALAQVLYYWKAPQHWVANQPGYQSIMGNYTFYVPELPATKFKWDDMCDTYEKEDNRTAEQDSAVAELMRYCGQALKMGYSTSVSGTPQVNMEGALKEFGFSEKTRCIRRSQYSTKEWESMLYDHLKRGIPVPYTGSSDGGGHSFVCDGYGGNGMFHINWGWGGISDDYFVLSVLNPYNNEGAGASSSSSGYNIEQMMVIDAVPVDYLVGELPYLTAGYNYEMLKMGEANDSIRIEVLNASGRNGVFEMALASKGADGSLTLAVPCFSNDGLDAASVTINNLGNFVCSISSAGLKDGTYDLYPVYRCVSVVGDSWKPLLREKYIRAVISDAVADITFMPALALCMEKLENKGNGYALETQPFVMTIRNDGEAEHNSRFTLVVKYEGDEEDRYTQTAMAGGFIPVGASVPVEFFVTPNLYGNATINIYSGQNVSNPFASFPITFNEPRKEFTEAIKPTNFSVAYGYDVNSGLTIGMSMRVINTFPQDLVRELVVIVQNKKTTMHQSLGRMGFKSNTLGDIAQYVYFTPSDIAEMHFNTDLSEGLDFFVVNPLGLSNYPILSLHLTEGCYVTENGVVTGIRDVYENEGRRTKDEDNGKTFSLMGAEVNDNFRGIVIKNGKKMLRK